MACLIEPKKRTYQNAVNGITRVKIVIPHTWDVASLVKRKHAAFLDELFFYNGSKMYFFFISADFSSKMQNKSEFLIKKINIFNPIFLL